MMDVSQFLNQAGLDPASEAGQKIINHYRSMSGLMNSLTHAQNIAGYKVDFDGVVEGLLQKTQQAVHRGYRQGIKDLTDLTKDVKDDFRYNTATKYINALSSVGTKSSILDGIKTYTYFSLLANKPTYVIQNLTEMLWGFSRLPALNKPLSFMSPLSQEYISLSEKAGKEGLFNPFFGEQMTGKSKINQLNILGNASESWSSRKIFELGLRIARDKGLTGEQAYREAYQFVFVGKPFYNQANTLVGLLDKEAGWVNKYGFIFLRWASDWINKFARGDIRTMLRTTAAYIFLCGLGGLPYGRKMLQETGLMPRSIDVKKMAMSQRFMISCIMATMGVGSDFLKPIFAKGLSEMGSITKGITMSTDQVKRANMDFKKYGIAGIAGHLPLAGVQYPILGMAKVKQGVVERRAQKRKLIYKPKTAREKVVLGAGLTPIELQEIYRQRYNK